MTDLRKVERHYGLDSLAERVEAALDKAGLPRAGCDWPDFAGLDQFHIRGLAATRELAAQLHPEPGSSLLDVGSGLGGPARLLAATYGCHVTGIDLSPAFVEVAIALARRCGLADRTTFRQADALELPFADSTFDHAWTQHVAMNIADRPRLYAEVRRVLKPGGSFAIYDVVAGDGPLHFPVPWARTPDISFLVDADEMRRLLTKAGFEVTGWHDSTPEAVAWFAAQAGAGTPPSRLALSLVMGPDFPQLAANLGRNLKEGRARVIQALLRRI